VHIFHIEKKRLIQKEIVIKLFNVGPEFLVTFLQAIFAYTNILNMFKKMVKFPRKNMFLLTVFIQK